MGMPSPSAGVYVQEVNQSQVATGVSSSIGAIVGESNRGPVGDVPYLCTSTKDFLAKFGNPDARMGYMHYCALAFLENGSQLYVTRVAPNALYGGCTVYMNNGLAAIEPWTSGQADPTLTPFQGTDLFHVYAVDPGAWNNDLSVRVYPNTITNDGSFYVDVYLTGQGQPVESFLVKLNYELDGYGVQLNIQENINRRSVYIRVAQNYEQSDYVANPVFPFINTLIEQQLVGGTNPTRATTGELMMGWDQYADPEQIDINLLINGGYTDVAIQRKMDEICQSRMDCMAILDVPSMEQKVQDAINYRRNDLMLDSTYSALYAPDYLILDQYNGIKLFVPPSGHVASAYARTDNEFDLWWAPAGMTRGRLNILGVRETYNQGDRDALYVNQINATRVILGSGIKIWGADTLSVITSALSNVSVRRLMIFLEKSLSEAVIYGVFDPNDEVLRSTLRDICIRFLLPIQNARGLYGFGVQCDEKNNPPEVIAAGDLMLELDVDPVLPAKRIHLTAIINKTGARFVNQSQL